MKLGVRTVRDIDHSGSEILHCEQGTDQLLDDGDDEVKCYQVSRL